MRLAPAQQFPPSFLPSFRPTFQGHFELSQTSSSSLAWTSYDDQKTWASSKAGHETKDAITKFADGPVYEDVVVFAEDAGPSIGARVVELVSWIHPTSNIDAEKEKKVASDFTQFQNAIGTEAPESDGGLVAGWGQIKFDHEGVLSRRFTSLIGWKSVQAHYDCKKTAPFLDNIHWLMDNDDAGVEMVHYAYSQSLEGKNSSI